MLLCYKGHVKLADFDRAVNVREEYSGSEPFARRLGIKGCEHRGTYEIAGP
jgi:hypothetical protein